MIWIPKYSKRPHIIRFEFIYGQHKPGIIHTGCSTRKEALAKFRLYHSDAIETEIVVLPKKGNMENPICHRLSHLEKTHPQTWFVAALGGRTLQRMIYAADRSWRKEKDKLRAKIRGAAHDVTKADFDKLPAGLKSRIKIDGSGCWLSFTVKRRNIRGNLVKNNRVYLSEYGKVQFGGKKWAVHRLVYTLLVGEIPAGTILRHNCDTPACTNPRHLQLGITEDNVRDMVERRRAVWQRRRKKR